MLEQSWEVYATKLANAKDGETLVQVVEEVIAQNKIDTEIPANVIYAYDTRYNSEKTRLKYIPPLTTT